MDKPKKVGEIDNGCKKVSERLAEIKDEEGIALDKKLSEVAGKEIKLSFPVGHWWTILGIVSKVGREAKGKMSDERLAIHHPNIVPLIRQFLQTKNGRRYVEVMEETVKAQENTKGD